MSKAWVYTGRDRGAERLELGRLLGEGAAGKVYALPGRPGSAAKLYHDDKTRKTDEAKIDAMLARPPQLPHAEHEGMDYPQVAWPEAKLYDAKGDFAGFLMPEIDFSRSTSLVNLLQKSSRRAEGISDYYGYRVLVARNLASVFAELHRAGHHMIDMKPANLRFYPAVSWMAVVDADGFSIAGKRKRIAAEQVSDEYIAPESWQKKPAELGEEQDLFGLAVIIFQLLNNGLHPFAGAAKGAGQATDLQGRILEGLYSYALHPVAGASPGAASIHKTFRRSTRKLFDRAFLNPADRPNAAMWRDHLDALVGMLVPCEAKPLEHAHFGTGCGFCAHEARLLSAAIARAKKADRRPRGVPLGAPAAPTATVPHIAPPRRGSRSPVSTALTASPIRRKRGGNPRFWKAAAPVAILCGLLAVAAASPWQSSLSGEEMDQNRVAAMESEPEAVPVRFVGAQRTTGAPPSALSIASTPRATVEPTPPTIKGPQDLSWPGGQRGRVPELSARAASLADRDADARFACEHRNGWIERRLCERPELAAAHETVSERYQLLLTHSTGDTRRLLADGQQRWLDARGRCVLAVKPDSCLSQSYSGRMADIAALEGA
ncbi:hypothetical protein [Sphingomonas sp. LT1P40]|uniref:hypothetical protein n=1 Tax=Alteristakelama amylovorans TaxID=3096166 RepID=UPI002FC77803